MPISYRIDAERQRVLTVAWGVLTDADILAHKERLVHDPTFDPSMLEISDVRRIERLAVTSAGVRAMIAHDSAFVGRRAGHRLALVVPADESFGMARMYQTLGEGVSGDVGVFRTMPEAEAWLDSSPPDEGRPSR